MNFLWPLLTLTFGRLAFGAASVCPDGIFPAYATWKVESDTTNKYLTVGGKWPADAISVPKCSRLRLVLQNLSPENVTLHFHGILQLGGQTFQDGAQGLSQSAVLPGSSFTYTFLLEKEGTYWIHSHSPGQYPKGVRGPLIVTNDAADKAYYGYKDEQTVTLSDWWPDFEFAHARSLSNSSDINTGTCDNPDDQNKNGYCIDYPAYRVLFNDVYGYSNATLNDDKRVVPLAACTDKKRIRIINMSSHFRYYVWLGDKREFDVIELDGVSYTAKTTDFVEISSG